MEIMTEYERIREIVKRLDAEACGLDIGLRITLGAEVEEAGIVEVIETAYLYGWETGYEAAQH